MNTMAKKFLTTILGSLLVFAVVLEVPTVSAASVNESVNMVNLHRRLDDGKFWARFRDSVMKDHDKREHEHKEPPQTAERPGRDSHSDIERHCIW